MIKQSVLRAIQHIKSIWSPGSNILLNKNKRSIMLSKRIKSNSDRLCVKVISEQALVVAHRIFLKRVTNLIPPTHPPQNLSYLYYNLLNH